MNTPIQAKSIAQGGNNDYFLGAHKNYSGKLIDQKD